MNYKFRTTPDGWKRLTFARIVEHLAAERYLNVTWGKDRAKCALIIAEASALPEDILPGDINAWWLLASAAHDFVHGREPEWLRIWRSGEEEKHGPRESR